MGAGMWAFSKFVMKKHPQVGAGIMMGTAAYHGAESIEHYLLRPYLQKAEFGQTGQRLIFNNEEDYFNHRSLGPSCTDGRKPVFLNKKITHTLPMSNIQKK